MKQFISLILAAACLISCVSKPASLGNFADGAGKEWKLLEISIESEIKRDIIFDRNTLKKEGSGEIFIMQYNTETISGTAAPNRYSAPFTLGENLSITLTSPMNTTQLAPLFQPEKLPEQDYYVYMQGIYQWKPVDGNLEFLSKTEDGREVRIIFGQ